MRVDVHLQQQSKPCRMENVRNTYQKGDFFCVLCDGAEVYKFPIIHIFRVKEVGGPQFIPPVRARKVTRGKEK